MSTPREKMKPLVGKRMKFRGIFEKTDQWRDREAVGEQDIRRACINDLEAADEIVADHVWVLGARHWEPFLTQVGKRVEFWATVKEYGTNGNVSYCLINADEPVFPHIPALKISDLGDKLKKRKQEETSLAKPPERPERSSGGQTGDVAIATPAIEQPLPPVVVLQNLTVSDFRRLRKLVQLCGSAANAIAAQEELHELQLHLTPASVAAWLAELHG